MLLVRYCVVLYARLRECVYHHAAYIIHSFSLAGGGQPVPAFLPPEPPPFPVPSRVHHSWLFPADYSACVQPIASASLAAYCSASSARAEFLQHVRRPLSGGSLRPACALGGNRLADSFQATLICSSKNNRRQAENTPTSRLSGVQPDKRRNRQTPRNQERYRTAGRVLPRSPRGDPSPLKLRRDKVYLLDCLSRRNAMKPEAATTGKAQNIPQHKAKPIVKFIVPSPLEPLTTSLKKRQKKDLHLVRIK